MTQSAIAYVDESGSLPDPGDRYLVFVAIVTTDPRALRKIVKKAGRKQKKVRLKRLKTQEVKWRDAPDGTKRRVLTILAQYEIEIFWLVVDKQNQAISDTPKNYGRMLSELVRECLVYHPELALMTDVHFSSVAQQDELNRIVMEQTGLETLPTHLESQQDSIIQLADFVAGAIRRQAMGRENFVNLIEGRVVVGKLVKWQELVKRK